MQTAIIFAIGIIIGCVLSSITRRVKSVGKLRIDISDPDGPYMFLELSKDINVVAKKEYIVLNIEINNFVPHN